MNEVARVTKAELRATQLYRCYAVDGALLYVGVSYSTVVRFAKHRKTGWSGSVGNIKVEMFPTRQAALTAELIAIRDERPRFNVIGISKPPKPPKIPRPPSTPQLSIRLAPDVVEYLRKRGQTEKRSMAFLLTEIVREKIAREAATKKRKSKAP